MSKPIKVLAVVIVVVFFVKTNQVQKMFDPQTIHAHKTLGLKVLYPKRFGSKKVRYQKVLVQKIKVKKIKVQKNWVT